MARKTIRRHSERSEESMTVVRKPVRRHQSDRFFTPCHMTAFLLSYKVFLPPFRMTGDGKLSSCTVRIICCCGAESMLLPFPLRKI